MWKQKIYIGMLLQIILPKQRGFHLTHPPGEASCPVVNSFLEMPMCQASDISNQQQARA